MAKTPARDDAGTDAAHAAYGSVGFAEGLGDIDTFGSIEEMDALYASAWKLVKRIEQTPVWLLRAALDEAEGDGLYSQGATFAAQAIDASYPEFGGAIEAALDEQFERVNERSAVEVPS